MTPPGTPPSSSAVEHAESNFVLTLGGFTLELPGARLVTHEKLASPRFNFVELRSVGVDRQAALFERALDHYFQRALRPEFRVRPPVPDHVERALVHFGFRRRRAPHRRLQFSGDLGNAIESPLEIRVARREELAGVVGLWTHENEREEFRRAVEVAWLHPHPGESLEPLIALRSGGLLSGAIVHSREGVAAIHLVATTPGQRRQGAATALVGAAIRRAQRAESSTVVCVFVDEPQAETALARRGFAESAEWAVYELPAHATLELPNPGPPQPPRWRPPRRPAPRG